MMNSLDHSIDPVYGIKQLLHVTKSGGWVLLRHAENEGLAGGFSYGLHQWAFTIGDEGDFLIWNLQSRINVNREFQGIAKITSERIGDANGRNYIHVDIKKLNY